MDPLTALILCFVLARWIVNRLEDQQMIRQGKEPPRVTRAKARAEASGRTPAQEYRRALWDDAFDQMRKKHAVRHGERFDRWEERRRRRAERRAEKKAAKEADKTAPGEPAKTTPEPVKTPEPEKKPESASGGPAPETTGAIPPMTSPVSVPPSGEINNQPTLVARTEQWRGFHVALGATAESARAGADSWQKAASLGVTSAEMSLSYLARHKVEGPVVASFIAAKEKQAVMADLAAQISALYTRMMEANTSAKEAFEAAQKQMPSHIGVREAHAAVEGSAGTTEFITSGG